MFVAGRHIPRRTFLRGAGATLALPLLDSMVPAGKAAGPNGGDHDAALCRHLRPARHGARLPHP